MCDLPELMTVEEAARYLGIGRTKAYAMARQWRSSGGRLGLPTVEIGSALRISRPRLEQLIAAAIAAGTCSASVDVSSQSQCPSQPSTPEPETSAESPPRPRTTPPSRRHRRDRPLSQLDLFDEPARNPFPGS